MVFARADRVTRSGWVHAPLTMAGAVLILSACGTAGGESDETSMIESPDQAASSVSLPPANGDVDYQIGGDYDLVEGTQIVSRDWFEGAADPDVYSICYVNAFQTQPDDPDVERPDETSAWPEDVVLTALAEDPNWTGEYLIDISTSKKRDGASEWVSDMVSTCADKGFDAVEFDNLDSWTRFEDIPSVQELVPFTREDTVAFASLITQDAHEKGMAAGQKNTVELIDDGSREQIGFDFAIAEECGQFDECGAYADAYDDHMIVIEYTDEDFDAACAEFASRLSIVRRDVLVSGPVDSDYVMEQC